MRVRHIFIAFILLIVGTVIGLTGLDFGHSNYYGVIQVDKKMILGSYQVIRSDEWGVLTPLCLSQMHHKPAFPVKNETIDVEGKNMLIVHDYGVPVKHISAIARPTTWGYFTGNIRIGMAWNWLFPLFIGFVGISLLLNLLLGVERINMVIALAIVYAPICSSWSNFPLYHLGLGAVAAWSFLQILSSENIKKNILLGLLCGWAASSFALTLYLPRLIPMSWLLIMFSIAIIVKDSLYNNLLKKFPYIILSLLVICMLLGSWYVDAKDAIDAILNSVYPGKRIVAGGYFTAWDFVRGWFPFQLVNYNAPISNQCELSSFPNLSFLIVILCILGFDKEHFSGSKVPVFLLGSVIIFFYIYQYIGFPSWLASVTFLGKSHPPRLDSSIMLAQVFLLSYLAKNCKLDSVSRNNARVCSIVVIALTGVCVVVSFFYGMPEPIKSYLLSQHTEHLIYFFALYALMVYSYLQNWRKGVCLMTVLFAVPGFVFNPLSKAPHRVTSNLPAFINVNAGTNRSRVLFITEVEGGRWQGNTANAVGIASLNGVHHYVDCYMYDRFYSKLQDGEQFNRFNHTMFVLDEKIERFAVDIPYEDVIRWKINPLFNFGELPVSYVAVSTGIKGKLVNNKSLKFIEDKNGFSYFRVNKP